MCLVAPKLQQLSPTTEVTFRARGKLLQLHLSVVNCKIFLPNCNNMSASFDIEKLKPDDLTKVNDFLLKNFFTREPLGLRLGIQPETDVSDWLSQVTQPLLEQQVLYMLCLIQCKYSGCNSCCNKALFMK